MIFDYEQAVDRHNRRYPSHEVYRIQSGLKLRQYVHRRHAEAIRLQTRSVIESAEQASTKSAVLAETYDKMEKYPPSGVAQRLGALHNQPVRPGSVPALLRR